MWRTDNLTTNFQLSPLQFIPAYKPFIPLKSLKLSEALTLSIGVLGGLDVLLTATILPVPVWITFTAWASFFALGGGKSGLITSVLCNFTGIIIASLSLLAADRFGGNVIAAAICVGIGSAAMVQASKLPFAKGFTPAIVWGFSQLVGATAAGFTLYNPITTQATAVAAVAMLTGGIFGYVSEIWAKSMASETPA